MDVADASEIGWEEAEEVRQAAGDRADEDGIE
jgi:hypothetical protein